MKHPKKAHCPLGVPPCRAVGYCHLHKSTLSVRQMKNRKCLSKKCRHLVPWKQHPFWISRAKRKERTNASCDREGYRDTSQETG